MLSFYFVDIQPPKLTSPDWYKSFYNMFYLSQLTNTLLLSYMKTFAQNEADGMIKHYPEILINKGIMDNSKNIEDIEEVYSLEVEAFLKQILYEFDNRLSGLNASTIPMGFQIEGLRNCKRELDFNQLFKLTGSKNWYTAIKGFLSLWEFLFLYSITESAIKEKFNLDKNTSSYQIMSSIKKAKNDIFKSKEDYKLYDNLWKTYTSLRNVYAHTHGLFDQCGINNIIKTREIFLNTYRSDSNFIINSFFLKDEDFFSNITTNSLFLINDIELNIFRNFISSFIFKLSEIK